MKNERLKLSAEMTLAYAAILLILAFSSSIVSLGGSTPARMAIKLLVYAAIAGIPFLICRLRHIPLSSLGFSKSNIGKQILIALCVFLITISVTVIIPLLAGLSKNDVLNFKSSSPGVLIFYILYDFFFVGFGEEFIFRGYFFTRIGTAAKSTVAAVVISSILFGLMHYPNSLNILQVLVTTVLGLVYGFARYKIRNCTLLSVSVAHGLQDAVIIVLSYFLL